MSAFVVAVLAAAFVATISLLLVSIGKKYKRKHMNQLLNRFSEAVSTYDLQISSQTILKSGVLALDGIHRKLIVQRNGAGGTVHHQVIDLDEVRSCSVKKLYGSIRVGSLNDYTLEQYLEKITLCFDFKTGKQPVEMLFYHHDNDPVSQVTELEQKAKDWEAVLSKMLSRPLRKTA